MTTRISDGWFAMRSQHQCVRAVSFVAYVDINEPMAPAVEPGRT